MSFPVKRNSGNQGAGLGYLDNTGIIRIIKLKSIEFALPDIFISEMNSRTEFKGIVYSGCCCQMQRIVPGVRK